jgi:hypothetical protein
MKNPLFLWNFKITKLSNPVIGGRIAWQETITAIKN